MSEVIDIKEFLERVQEDKELLLELLEIFQEDFVVKRNALDEALKANSAEQIKQVAHSLKGSSGNISAKGIYANTVKLEQLAQSDDLKPIETILKDIDGQFEELKRYAARLKQEFGV